MRRQAVNVDLTKRAVVDTATMSWIPSPMAGAERKMLARDGKRWLAPPVLCAMRGSRIAASYPAGAWVRAPIGSSHAPKETEGAPLL